MDTVLILVVVLIVALLVLSINTLVFTRQGKNLVVRLTANKKYVIVHLKRAHTDFEDIWNIVPSPDYYTTVGKYDYDLNPQYAVMKWKNRLHFQLNENDAIPQYLSRKDSRDEILVQVREIRTALHNRAYELLFGKSPNIAMIIALIACLISAIIAIYGIYEIQKIAPIIQWLYEHPPQELTQNATVVIRR